LFRTINALISSQLVSDLGLAAGDLGLLTAVYFLTFAAAQLPVGILLDRYGPRRVQSMLLLVAATGAALFSSAQGYASLVMARGLIGLGVAAALMAGFKATVLWFPKDRLPLINGCMVMLGATGALTATAPAELLLGWTDWRGLFEILAAMTVVTATAIYFLVPELERSSQLPAAGPKSDLKSVYTDARFWRMAPLSAMTIGTAWSLQGLWAAPWLVDVEGAGRSSVVTYLLAMAAALSLGALLLGVAADRLRRRGVGPETILTTVATLFMAVQLGLIFRAPVPSMVLWTVVAAVGAATVLSYAMLAEYFPKELAGRANGALNVFHIGGAFVVQYSTGLVIQQWTGQNGHYPAIAYQVAFGVNLMLQAVALIWFVWPRQPVFQAAFTFIRACTSSRHPDRLKTPAGPYAEGQRVWQDRLSSARAQAMNWRLAGAGSAGLCLLLVIGLAVQASRASVIPHTVEVESLDHARAVDASASLPNPSDPQIAYFLARFVRNFRSLSTDPVIIRRSWFEAFDFVTDEGAHVLNTTDRLVEIGRKAIVVDVVYIVRASRDSFELRWREQTYENGALVGTAHFTALSIIVLRTPRDIKVLSRNPLGLYVHEFKWSPTPD